MKKSGRSRDMKIIKDIVDDNKISTHEIQTLARVEYPLFSFRWLQKYSFHKCSDGKFFHNLLFRLQKLSELGWKEIRISGRHQFGMEKIPLKSLKPNSFPKIVTPDVNELDVFRSTGDNRSLVGIQQGKIFHVIFIEAVFGDLYIHG